MCSNCGSIVKKTLSERVHECPYCGFVADRDYNAAVNIHRVGMEQPFEPVETMPLHHISVVQVLSMKQEAPPERRGVVHCTQIRKQDYYWQLPSCSLRPSPFFLLVSMGYADDDEAAHGRVSGYDRMTRIMRNDSEVLDLFEGGQIFKAGVFNETGESVKFICLSSSPACGGRRPILQHGRVSMSVEWLPPSPMPAARPSVGRER
jgi:hypothetical protein